MRSALLLGLTVGLWGLACQKDAPKPPEGPAPACDLLLQGVSLQYRGRALPLPGPVSAWDEVLGMHSRQAGVVDEAYVWDQLGIFAFRDNKPERIEGFFVLLNQRTDPERPDLAYWPRTPFKGRLCVDGSVLTSRTKLEEVNRDKRGPRFSRGYLHSIYSYDLTEPQAAYVRLDLSGEDALESFSVTLTGKQ